MKVVVFDEQKDLLIHPKSVKPIVESLLLAENALSDEVAIYFVTVERISQVHEEFFDDPAPTDCISFPIDKPGAPGYHILGEIFICPKTGIDYLLQSKLKEQNIYLEITLYLVHGLLHLLGFDDLNEKDRKKMRAHEKKLMQRLLEEGHLLY